MERRKLKPGIAPSVQLKKANKGRGRHNKFTYLPHTGAKQLAKAAKLAAGLKRLLAELAWQKKQEDSDA